MNFFSVLHRKNPVLSCWAWVNLILFTILLVVSQFDTRQITGINAWIKPMKFCISVAIYGFTMAWLLHYLSNTKAVRRISWWIAGVMLLEQIFVISQAARGVKSHFNNSTPYDSIVFDVMGLAITINTCWIGYAAYLFFKERKTGLPDRVLWGIRLGLVLFIVFSLEGFDMASHYFKHIIGAPDGGEGLPFINWSRQYGDLRTAHFFGLHSLQVLPLFGHFIAKNKWHTLLFGIIWFAVCAGMYSWALMGNPLF